VSPAYDRRVYDSDLAAQPLLRGIAVEYARSYDGNFDLMVQAKMQALATGDLQDGLVRSVLNTLRTDPLAPNLWAAACALLSPVKTVQEWGQVKQRRQFHETKARQERAFKVLTDGTWKVPLATAVHMASRPVVHLMRSDCTVEWWLHRLPSLELDYSPGRGREPEVKCRTFCKSWGLHAVFWRELPTYDDAYPGRWEDGGEPMPLCRACVRICGEAPDLLVWRGEVE
jgi:hypothetical protein